MSLTPRQRAMVAQYEQTVKLVRSRASTLLERVGPATFTELQERDFFLCRLAWQVALMNPQLPESYVQQQRNGSHV